MGKIRESDQDGWIIIAVDWGTTFAAASYAYLEQSHRSTDIRLGEFPSNNLKCIYFPDSSGNKKQVKTQMAWLRGWLWGHEVDQAIHNGEIEPDKRIEFLKLALDKREEKTQDWRAVIQKQLEDLPDECGVATLLQLISTFLNKMFTHILHKIVSARGYDVTARAKLECILSVPALWEFEQREMMIKAAEMAGIHGTRLVSEPEAAATFCIHERLVEQPALRNNLIEGTQSEGLLALDAGGGTVDIITYIANKASFREGAVGTGGTCGSVFLNWGFRNFIEWYLKDDMAGLLQSLRKPICAASRQSVLDRAIADFEIEKQNWNGEDLTIRINGIKQIPSRGIYDDRIVIPSFHIEQIFDQILNEIIEMTTDQIKVFNERNAVLGVAIQYILFVGGFSGSPYAQARLRAEFGPKGIEVRVPDEDSSTLISRGALLKFLYQDSIGEYYLRCSYGVAWDEEYDKELHKERYNKAIHGERKIYNDFHDGHPIVQERIRWLHKYGRQVKVGRREGLRGWIGVALHGKFQIREELYRSKYETKDGLPVRDPQNDITEVGAIEFTIDEVEGMGHLETNEETGMEYQKIEYEISMTFDNPRSKFEMIIPDGGLFPDKEQWGEKYSLYEADIHLAAAVFATPAPIECGTRGQKAVAVSARGIRRSKRLAASR